MYFIAYAVIGSSHYEINWRIVRIHFSYQLFDIVFLHYNMLCGIYLYISRIIHIRKDWLIILQGYYHWIADRGQELVVDEDCGAKAGF